MQTFAQSAIRALLRCPVCMAAALQDSPSGLSCASCKHAFTVDGGVIDLRTTDGPQHAYPFYASSSYRLFADKQTELHQEHYRRGSLSNAIEDSMKKALRALRTDVSGPLVELGCGGTPMIDWATHPASYVGVDQSLELLQRAKSANPEATFIAANLHRLPFVDRCLSVVVANAVLEHVFRLEVSVEEIARSLNVDGSLYVLVPTEGGLAVEVARAVTSRRNARILGISARDCRDAQTKDHCNSVFAIGNALKKHFQLHRTRYWPFLVGGAHLNLAKMWIAQPLCADRVQ
jgi:SAM-dependent methyltransferase